jgi:hypothetical protein
MNKDKDNVDKILNKKTKRSKYNSCDENKENSYKKKINHLKKNFYLKIKKMN